MLERQNEVLLSALLKGGGASSPSHPTPPSIRKAYVPYKTIETSRSSGIAQEHVEALARRLGEKCKSSKEFGQKHRRAFANNRAIAGFRPDWKEMVYPLIAARADGSRIWDPDGTEYIDLTMGFGVSLFGYNPGFVMEAIRGARGSTRPMLPGSPLGMTADVIDLDYDDPATLDYVATHGSELAAVLVEPVQSRHVEVRPRDFLHRLRELTTASGTALIFDEAIHPRSRSKVLPPGIGLVQFQEPPTTGWHLYAVS